MKYLILVGDGMADFPLDELDGKTPLEYATTPEMDAVASLGILGEFTPIPDGFAPGSDIGNLSLYGYDPGEAFTGRAPLEAANQGILLKPDEVAFRCNLVTLDDGVMASFTAGHISSEEGSQLMAALNEAFKDELVTFHSGVSYRNLCVVKAGEIPIEQLTRMICTPPHNVTDQEVGPYLPSGPGAEYVRDIMDRSVKILADHPINRDRRKAGKAVATSVWLWGQGQAPAMPTYAELLGRTGAVVSAVDLVKGIGVCAGLRVLDVPGATGYLDTNYEGKVTAALEALNDVDMAYVHIEAPDETAHEGRADLKLQAIQDFDNKVVGPCLRFARDRGDTRVLVAPDHVTAIATKTHAPGPVPFAIAGAGIEPNDGVEYTEVAARASGLLVDPGFRLVRAFLTQPVLDAEALRQAATAVQT